MPLIPDTVKVAMGIVLFALEIPALIGIMLIWLKDCKEVKK